MNTFVTMVGCDSGNYTPKNDGPTITFTGFDKSSTNTKNNFTRSMGVAYTKRASVNAANVFLNTTTSGGFGVYYTIT